MTTAPSSRATKSLETSPLSVLESRRGRWEIAWEPGGTVDTTVRILWVVRLRCCTFSDCA